MAGMEGYFGPRHYPTTDKENLHWNYVNRDGHEPRRASRPTNIELQHKPSPVSLESAAFLAQRSEEEALVRKYVGVGVSLATLITENLLSHPFVVLRRQCQVNHNSKRYHLVPITLIPVIVHLHQRQGITTLWKGIGSVLLVRGMSLAIEDLISKLTPWPKEIKWHTHSLKSIGQHIFLKCITLAIITPFYSASLVETVQSDIASEKPGVFDVFKEGICRLLSWSSPQKGRMLPVWTLVIPTVMYGLLKYLFSTVVKNVAFNILHIRQKQEKERQGAFPKDWFNQTAVQDIEVSAQLISLVAADTLFYPLETILHRLHLQGTRTIIDNLDSGLAVIPILTSYEGTIDCYDTSLTQEGSAGLYKGFGALVLQFSAHFAVLKLVKYVVTQAAVFFKQPPPLPPVVLPHQPPLPAPPRNMQLEQIRTPLR